MTEFVSNREIYERVIRDAVPNARQRLWIATADIKDMYVDAGGPEMAPFLEVLSDLIGHGVEIRLIHAKEPGPNFREEMAKKVLALIPSSGTRTTKPKTASRSCPCGSGV